MQGEQTMRSVWYLIVKTWRRELLFYSHVESTGM